LNRNNPGSHSRKSSISTEAYLNEIVKSSSSIENSKLETIQRPNKDIPTVIKRHGDSDNSKSKSSSKMNFGGSPDLFQN
jgi:hypothetical protein